MLRFAAPVFDTAGRPRGVVVLNVLGDHILAVLQTLAPVNQNQLRVLNAKGFWLRGARREDEWGFMLPERAGRTLAITAPKLWGEISSKDKDQSRALGGLFTWQRISPAQLANRVGVPAEVMDDYLVIASDLDAAAWNAVFSGLRRMFTGIGIILLVLTTLGVGLLRSRKQAGERLEAASRLNAAVIGTAQVAVISTTPEGLITGFNPTAERLLGWQAAEVIGKQTRLVFHVPEEVAARATKLSAELGGTVAPGVDVFALKATRDDCESSECIFVRKDGYRFPVLLSISVLRDALGRVTGYLKVATDLTARKQVEQAILAASAAAEASVRLKSRFLANMSHEIRTPMNGVIGLTGLLLDTDLNDDQRSLARTVQTSADSLLTVINDILDFSKIEAGQLQFEALPFELMEPIENCLLLVAERAQAKNLEIGYLVEENVPAWLNGDAGRIQQVVLNLLSNAVKFTARGKLVLSVTKLSEQAGRARLRFAVRDTGPGLSTAQQAKLFQPFVQADVSTTRNFGGPGLGLAICKQLVVLMNGEIGIESEPDKGSTFWFTIELPVVEAAPRILPGMEGLAGRRVLVVDDNETSREILKRQLSGWGADPTTVANGEEALAALRSSAAAGSPYHLAVLDMQMPGLSGLEIAGLVHSDAALASLKMIILTSMSHTLTRRELGEAGVQASLVKPVRQMQLHDALASVLGGSPATGATERHEQSLATAGLPADLKLRVLVAEDNPVNQLVARRMLQKFGCETKVVGDGAKAIEAACSRPYDVIFMDCQMPNIDGFDATRRIREWEAGRRARGKTVEPMYIVAMTANAMAGDREACLAAGMTGYLSKPVHDNELLAALTGSPASQAHAENLLLETA